MKLFDDKFRHNKLQYVFQSLLAMVAVAVAMLLIDWLTNAVIVAALGATAFVVFSLPLSRQSHARAVIGGYVVSIAVGTLCFWLAAVMPARTAHAEYALKVVFGAGAVGLAVFVMTITNTEHSPAAGVALGLSLGQWELRTVAIVMLAVVTMVVLQRILRRHLRDLAR